MKNRTRQWYSLPVRREIEEARALWEEIFPEDSAEFLDYYEQWKSSHNWIQTRHAGGKLVSMIHWNPYRVQAGSEIWESYYLVAVATRPEYRHRGLMRGQLREGIELCRAEGVPFVFLMPADPEIYRPFGFHYFYDRRKREIADPWHQSWVGSEKVDIRPIRQDEIGEAADFLDRELSRRFAMYPLRDEEYLRRTSAECQSEEGDLEGIFSEGRLIGVLSCWGVDPIEIRELILAEGWEIGEGRDCVEAAMCKKWQSAGKIQMITTSEEDMSEPIMMGRITNLEAFLSPVTASEPVELQLRVTDPLIPENAGDFLWRVTEEGSQMIREQQFFNLPDLEIGIEDLFSWLTGYRALSDVENAKIPAEGEAKIAKVRPFCGTFFTEVV